VELAHAGNNGLTSGLILPDLEGGIFFRQFDQGVGHLVLIGFGLRFNRNRNNRIGEADGLQQYRVGGITQRVAGETEFQA